MIAGCLSKLDMEIYHTGELSDEDAQAVRAHLQSCNLCRDSHNGFLSDQDLLGKLRSGIRTPRGTPGSSFQQDKPKAIQSPTMPRRVQGYEIIRELQRGGQGVVYLAEQLATKRKVAIKVLLEDPFCDPEPLRRRFESEIELASNLRHPNIVSIHDSGLVEGHFYYAMEHVDGPRLDEYVKSQNPSTKDVVGIFRIICSAVSYAHQHGVIHRDLKPSNIRIDASGQPRLLDFGLAKKIRTDLPNDQTDLTLTNEFMGTLAYAAPEQIRGDSSLVDTRTDVYSLGVLFYELLTGEFPYPVTGRLPEVAKHIAKSDPTKPSAINKKVDAELDAIILKALEKSPQQRYPTAGHLEDDLDRYLRGDPIEARSASSLYVISKVVKRHRSKLGAFAAMLSVLMGLSTWFVWSVAQARQAETTARMAAAEINDFLKEMLGIVQPEILEHQDIHVVVDMLDKAAKKIDAEYRDQPLAESALRTTIGNAYRRLGFYQEAELQLRAALAIRLAEHGETKQSIAESKSHLAMLLRDKTELDEAEDLARDALDTIKGMAGHDHGTLAAYQNDLGLLLFEKGQFEEAEELYCDALKASENLHQPHPEVASITNNLAMLMKAKGEYARAESHYHQALQMYRELAGNDLHVSSVLNNLAELAKINGDYVKAEVLYRESLAIRRGVLSDEHITVAQSMDNLAVLMRHLGRHDEAEQYYLEALDIRDQILGEDHLDVARNLNNLGMVYLADRRYAEAEQLLQKSLNAHQQVLGKDHPESLTILNNVAGLKFKLRNYAEAELLFHETLELRRRVFGDKHKDVAAAMNNLASVLREKADYKAAGELYREALAINLALFGNDHHTVADNKNNLALTLKHLGNHAEAEQLYRQAISTYREVFGDRHPNVANAASNLAKLLVEQTRHSEAEPLILESHRIFEAIHGPEHPRTEKSVQRLIKLYEEWGKAAKAAEYESLLSR